jgi:hypothetical protein
MARINKIVTSQLEGRNTSDPYPEGTFLFDNNNVLVHHNGTTDGTPILGPGVVYGYGNDSGDGAGLNTIKLIPDANLYTDQYLIIDPTAPNHIHIRAGGGQDTSDADLFLGAENTHVRVSDNSNNVTVAANDNQWDFGSDGTLYGPADGGVKVAGLLTEFIASPADNNLNLFSSSDIILNADGGSYITSTTIANQIATQGYVDSAIESIPEILKSVVAASTDFSDFKSRIAAL